jgi:hypothetical protein
MDLVTLVTACALGVEPKLMHALIWHQSGGEPWAVSVHGETLPRVYPSMREAVSETRAFSAGNTVRVGLAGIVVDPSNINAAMFLPCRNVSLAARHIEKLTVRCKTHPRLKTDPTSCAVAVYHGSWGEPDTKFADAVMASLAKGDAPNFDMPKNTSMEFLDVASEASPRLENAASPESAMPFDDRERGWSSALFPARGQQPVSPSIDRTSNRPGADESQSHRASDADPSTTRRPIDGLFVARSPERRPQ